MTQLPLGSPPAPSPTSLQPQEEQVPSSQEPTTIPTHLLFSTLSVMLLVVAVASLLFTSGMWQRWSRAVVLWWSPVPLAQTLQPSPSLAPLAEPVTELVPLMKECLFFFSFGCVTNPGPTVTDTKEQYQDYAQDDIPFILSLSQQSALPVYTEVIPPELFAQFWPKQIDPEQPRTAAEILMAVSQKTNVNPRLLLTLLEVHASGKGVLLGGLHPQLALSSQPTSFTQTLATMAEALQRVYVPYDVARHANQPLPTTLIFFGKSYAVSPSMDPASLAVITYLGQTLPSKTAFERAIVVRPTEVYPENNVVALYAQLFRVYAVSNTPL